MSEEEGDFEKDEREICTGCKKHFDNSDLKDCGSCEDCCDHKSCYDCGNCVDKINECGRCEDCCNHSYCSSCKCCVEYICDNCEQCNDCCECLHCNNCDSAVTNYHHDRCECCSECCDCESDQESDDQEYGDSILAKSPDDLKEFNCKRSVGVEWEYNSSNNSSEVISWAESWGGIVQEDASCGYEAVTPPIAGDHIKRCLTELSKKLRKADCNHKCGVHVHVDAGDFTWSDMYRLLKVYSKLEPLLYLFAGQHRATNRYCYPVGDLFLDALSYPDKDPNPAPIRRFVFQKCPNKRETEIPVDKKEAILNIIFTDRNDIRKASGKILMKDFKGYPSKKLNGRYRGLNICPWVAGRRGGNRDTTVEFRIHRNTLDATRLIGWVQLCARIVDWSYKATNKEVDDLPKSSLIALCQVIAPDLKDWMLNRVSAFRKDTQKKYRCHRLISFVNGSFSFNDKLNREIKNSYDES